MMTTTSPTDRRPGTGRGAFTLIELLVVMAVIAGLVAILAPTVNSALKRAVTVRAATDVKSLETAWKGYYQEYGTWPVDGRGDLLGQPADENDPRSRGIKTSRDIVALLAGSDLPVDNYDPDQHNPRLVQFMEFPETSLNEAGDFVDPYDQPYRFLLDVDYDNRVNQYVFAKQGSTAAGDNGILKTVIAWSKGPDGQDATDDGSAVSPLSRDDIRSWK